MATIKVKNAAGEWETVASAEATTITNELTGILNAVDIAVPYGSETNTLDLSQYVSAGDDFFIIFGVTTTKNQGTENVFAWWKKDGKLRTVRGTLTSTTHASLNAVFPTYTGGSIPIFYDEATGIFSMNDDTYKFIENALLFYTEIKEA